MPLAPSEWVWEFQSGSMPISPDQARECAANCAVGISLGCVDIEQSCIMYICLMSYSHVMCNHINSNGLQS